MPDKAQVRLVTDGLEQSPLDNRSYRVIRLGNDLEVLLAHDPDADMASACMDVNVGSFSDDDDMPGIAHALKRLISLGSKEYPAENEFEQYVTTHSGYYNACTLDTAMKYYFRISAEAHNDAEPAELTLSPLFGALDRFSHFFKEPLFPESAVNRELEAVDSEFKKNLWNDTCRLDQLERSLSNPNHPYCRFTVGNLEALKIDPKSEGKNIRERIFDFYGTHYSANCMKLAILGREPLDVLQKWAVELFSGVPDKNLSRNRWAAEVPLRKSELGMQCFAKPVEDLNELHLYFPLFDDEEMYESQPGRYLCHLVGHKGPGSILAFLKSRGWAGNLISIHHSICPGSPSIFECVITLTKQGLKHYKDIIKVIFQYVALLRQTPPEEWRFNELKYLSEIPFKFGEKRPGLKFAMETTSLMRTPIPRRWLLSGFNTLRKFNPSSIRQVIGCLRPDNFRMILLSREFPGDWDRCEKWYGTEYKLRQLPHSFIQELWQEVLTKTPLDALHLPGENPFVPTKFYVQKKEVSEPADAPVLLRNDEFVRTWWKKDDTFFVPRVNQTVHCKSPLIYKSAENVVKTRLFINLVLDDLETSLYDARLAGLHYNIGLDRRGLYLTVSGYDHKSSVALEKILRAIRNLEIQDARFNVIKEYLGRAYENDELQPPYRQTGEYLAWLSWECGYITEEFTKELPCITAEALQGYLPLLLDRMHIEQHIHGNIEKREALRLTDMVQSTLGFRILPETQWPSVRSLILPPGSNYIFQKTLKDPDNVNNCIEYCLYAGDKGNPDIEARVRLICQVMSEPAFSQLRTEEQLGYVVSCSAKWFDTTCGIGFQVQSEQTPQYLESRVDAFLVMFGEQLENMTNTDFQDHKASVITGLLKKFKTLEEESSYHWDEISDGHYGFNYRQIADYVRKLEKEDLVKFYKRHISSPTRAKLVIQLFAPGRTKKGGKIEENPALGTRVDAALAELTDATGTLIKDVRKFKASLEVSEAATPVREIGEYEEKEEKEERT